MKKSWSKLPNARYIDQVLESSEKFPQIWAVGAISLHPHGQHDSAWVSASQAITDLNRHKVLSDISDCVYSTKRQMAGQSSDTYRVVMETMIALIAYDNSGEYLNLSSNKLKMLALLSEHPAQILLLRAVIALEKIKELEFSM